MQTPQSTQNINEQSTNSKTSSSRNPISNGTAINGEEGSPGNARSGIDAPTQNGTATEAEGRSSGMVNGDMAQSQPTAERLVQTRKRSRSGTRISRPLVEGNHGRRRGTGDADGKAVENVMLQEYVHRDSRHWAAMLRQSAEKTEILDGLREERILNLKLRGIEVDVDGEKQSVRRTDEYPVAPLTNPAAVYGPGYGHYGTASNRLPTQQPGIMYPSRKPRVGGRRAKELRVTRREAQKHAEQLEELVPIRLDIEWEKVRLRDTFTWNLHDRMVPLELFAHQLVEDFGLSLDNCGGLIQQVMLHIQEQVMDYFPHPFIDDGAEDPHLPYTAYKDDEMRITIKLNITIGQHTLVDQFEWDINNSSDSAELFARQMATELSLSGEFVTAIAHDIREQCQLFTRSLYIVGHAFDGRPVADQDLQAGMMPSPMPSAFRPYQAAKEFSPYLYELNEAGLERTELSLSREERRQKRSVNRRGGPALPDLKDRRKTIRTLVVSSIIPGAAETLEDSRILKRTVATSSKPKRTGYREKDGLEDSDDSESEVSTPGSPVIPQHLLSGTARTRVMRGAVSKGALGRSATPESSNLHHHETRTRRRDYREESVDDSPPTLIIKLRINPHRFKQFLRDHRNKHRPTPLDSPQRRSKSATPGHSTPKPGTMGPPSTPGQQHSQHIANTTPHREPNSIHPHAAQMGRVNAKGGPPNAQNPAPAPPDWLNHSLKRLQQAYPDDLFEGTMRYTMVSVETDLPIQAGKPGEPNQENVKMMFYPRIKCLDCPGKLYTPGPETGVTNFEVHLKNKLHREKVDARVSKEKGG